MLYKFLFDWNIDISGTFANEEDFISFCWTHWGSSSIDLLWALSRTTQRQENKKEKSIDSQRESSHAHDTGQIIKRRIYAELARERDILPLWFYFIHCHKLSGRVLHGLLFLPDAKKEYIQVPKKRDRMDHQVGVQFKQKKQNHSHQSELYSRICLSVVYLMYSNEKTSSSAIGYDFSLDRMCRRMAAAHVELWPDCVSLWASAAHQI